MSIGIGDALGKSFGFAFENTFKHIGRWLGMAILMCIPIVNLIVMGMFLKVYRNEEPNFSNAGKSFVQGLLSAIIGIIYFIIPFIIAMVLGVASLLPVIASAGTDVGAIGAALTGGIGIVSMIIIIVVSILFFLIFTPAIVNFARNGFGAAFKFGEIFGMIGKLGWGKYILAILLLIVVMALIGLVLGLIAIIPIIGWIIIILAMPIIYLVEYKYWGLLFE